MQWSNLFKFSRTVFVATIVLHVVPIAHVRADDASLRKVTTALLARHQDTQTAPTYDDLLQIQAESNVVLTRDELVLAAKTISSFHEPLVTKRDLIELSSAQRDAIESFEIVATVDRSGTSNRPVGEGDIGESPAHEKITNLKDRNKYYLERQFGEPHGKPAVNRHVISYDGTVVRELIDFAGDTMSGITTTFFGANAYVTTENVLLQSMLLDSKEFVGALGAARDDLPLFLKEDLTILLGSISEANQAPLLVASNLNLDVTMDPMLSFAVVKTAHFTFDRGSGQRVLNCINRMRDYKEYENGLWLPGVCERTWYKSGQVVGSVTTTVEKMQINHEVDSSRFSKIFPVGTTVVDNVENITYIAGEESSIDQLVRESVPTEIGHSRRSAFRWWMIVTNVLVVGFLLVLLLYAKRKRSLGG